MLENQIAIITGGASGIGKGIALEFAKEGSIVVIADLNKEKSDQTLEEIRKFSPSSISISTDISQETDLNNLVRQGKEKFGKVNILINNAGIGTEGTPLEVTKENWQKAVDTNLTGSFFLTQSIANLMIETKTKGKIVFISSVHQKIPSRHAQYSSSKAALGMIVKEFALELAKYEIRVNGIAPGAIRSREEMKENYEPTPLYHQKGATEDIAKMALVLSSDYFSRYVTGEIVFVDGALSLLPAWGWEEI